MYVNISKKIFVHVSQTYSLINRDPIEKQKRVTKGLSDMYVRVALFTLTSFVMAPPQIDERGDEVAGIISRDKKYLFISILTSSIIGKLYSLMR